jgi:hypothetical protein
MPATALPQSTQPIDINNLQAIGPKSDSVMAAVEVSEYADDELDSRDRLANERAG